MRGIDTTAAERIDGVVAVLTHHNAPRLAVVDDDNELFILRNAEVAFRGQAIGAVIATSLEVAREAAAQVLVTYDERPAEVTFSADSDDLYTPEDVSVGYRSDTSIGDIDAALDIAPVTIDQTYTTAMVHDNPMEPHAMGRRHTGAFRLHPGPARGAIQDRTAVRCGTRAGARDRAFRRRWFRIQG